MKFKMVTQKNSSDFMFLKGHLLWKTTSLKKGNLNKSKEFFLKLKFPIFESYTSIGIILKISIKMYFPN